MRVLVLSKRQYTGRDLLDDRYGRVFEIPAALARRGHTVLGIALSYRRRPEGEFTWPAAGNLTWRSVNLGALCSGLARYRRELVRAASELEPDAIWATSDAYHAMVGSWLSTRSGVPLVLDLYDNYESFGGSRLPGVTRGLRAAARRAAAVTVVSSTLKDWIVPAYGLSRPPHVVGNAVATETFHARDRKAARVELELPEHARIIGVAGALTRSRGIADVFDAFVQLASSDPDVWLAIAGPRDGTPARYSHPRIRDLGLISPAAVPVFLSALDVAVVSNIDSAFGRYCFPQKLFEAVACGAPVVAARVGEVARLLAAFPKALYAPHDVPGLTKALRSMLDHPARITLPPPRWQERAEQVEAVLQRLEEPRAERAAP